MAAVYDEYHREKTWKRCTFSYFVPAVDVPTFLITDAYNFLVANPEEYNQ